MGFEEGADPVDGWGAPGQALVLFATRSLPLSAQIMFRCVFGDHDGRRVCVRGRDGQHVRFLSGRRGMLLEGVRHPQAAPQSRVMNSRRFMSDMGLRPAEE